MIDGRASMAIYERIYGKVGHILDLENDLAPIPKDRPQKAQVTSLHKLRLSMWVRILYRFARLVYGRQFMVYMYMLLCSSFLDS